MTTGRPVSQSVPIDSWPWWAGRQGKDHGQLKRVLRAVTVFHDGNQFPTACVNACRHMFHDKKESDSGDVLNRTR